LTAIAISTLVHITIIAAHIPSLDSLRLNKATHKIKVTYIKATQQHQALPQKNMAREPLVTRIPPKVIAENKSLLEPLQSSKNFLKRSAGLAVKEPNIIKPFAIKPDIIPVKKKISLPPVDMAKISNPSYISYYQLIREKIRRCAYQNYSRTETGEIYLSFVIGQDGSLRDLRLVEEKSTPNYYLRDIALRSIRAASPFPAFPKELDYPQLSFNVIISFEME